MNKAFRCLGNRQRLTYITPEIVLVTTGAVEDSCVLFVGYQCSGVTLASNTIWTSEVTVCSALAMARTIMEQHKEWLEFEG